MHVRSSFVTNSSSSSFVAVKIKSTEISNILREFYDELVKQVREMCGEFWIDGDDTIHIDIYEGYCTAYPSLEGILDCLASLLDYQYSRDCEYKDYEFDDEDDEYEDKEHEMNYSKYSKVIQKLMENKQAVLDSIEEAEITDGQQGWQGDDDSRYYEDWYEPEALEDIQNIIMEEHGYSSVDEITDEDFCDYVGNKMSIEERTICYNKKTGKITNYRTTELE